MSLFLQVLSSGVANGFVYGLIGLGLAVIYRGSTILNAAQGDIAIVGAFVTVVLVEQSHAPYWLAIVGGVLVGGLLGTLVEIVCIRPLLRRKAEEETMLLVTIGLSFLLGAILLTTVGKAPHFLPQFGGEKPLEISGVAVQWHAIVLVLVAIAVVGSLMYFYKRTRLGLAMVAASIDQDGAASIGINVSLMRTGTFFLGGLIGAIGGVLQTPLIGVSFQMGIAVTLKGVAAAILGGLVNPMGAVVGGLILGVAEALTVIGISSGYQNIVAMGLLIVIMISMPNGIFSSAQRKGG